MIVYIMLSGHFGTVHIGTLAEEHDPTVMEIVAIKTVKGMYSRTDVRQMRHSLK